MGWLFWAGIALWDWTSAWARSRGCGATRETDRGQQEHTGVWRGVSEQHLSLHHTPRVQVQRAGVEVKGRDSKSRCEKLKVKVVGGAVCPGKGGETATLPSAHRHPLRPTSLPPDHLLLSLFPAHTLGTTAVDTCKASFLPYIPPGASPLLLHSSGLARTVTSSRKPPGPPCIQVSPCSVPQRTNLTFPFQTCLKSRALLCV